MTSSESPGQASVPTSALYREAVESFVALARTLTADQWAQPVPCLPGWDVRDVLSHVSGVPDDALAGRLDGVATEPWTASQVERNRDFAVDELLDRWLAQYAAFGDALDAMDEYRPPYDAHAHEHDVRHALGLPGNRASRLVETAAAVTFGSFELPTALTVVFDDGRTVTAPGTGDGGSGVTVTGLSSFEVFRSRLGRRSRSQVEAYDWSGDAADVAAAVDGWFNFGPADAPVIE